MKDPFEMLNDVVVDMDEYEEVQMNDVEKKMLKKRVAKKLKKRKSYRKRSSIMIVAAAIILFFSVPFNMHSIAEIPLIVGKKIEELIDSKGMSLQEYKKTVGETVYNNDVEVHLNEVLLDDEELYVNSTFKSTKIDLSEASPFLSVYVNGEHYGSGGLQVEKVNDYTYTFLYSHDMPGIDLSKELDIKIVFEDILLREDEKIWSGEWGFSVKTSGEKLLVDTKTIPVKKQFQLENGQQIEVNELKITPISTKLNFTIKNDIGYHVFFTAKDQNGNELDFNSGVTDEKNSHIRFEKLSDDVEKIIFTPDILPVGQREENDRGQLLQEESFEVQIK